MTKRRITATLVICVFAMTLGSCSRNKNGAQSASAREERSSQSAGPIPGLRKTWGIDVMKQPGTVFHVEYSDNTAIVDQNTVARTFRGVSADHRIFLFEDSPALRQKLVPGKFVLFEGLDLRKVDALAVDGQTLIVGTETAPLNEALKNAQIQLEIPVDFKQIHDQIAAERRSQEVPPPSFALLKSLSQVWDGLEPRVYAAGPNDLEGDAEFKDDKDASWKLHYQNTFNPDHSADINITIHRHNEDGLNVEIDAKSHLSKFIQKDAILMSDGQFKSASFQNVGLHGSVDLDWGIATSEGKRPMEEDRVKIPHPIKIPLMETTGLPMTLEISEALLFHPAFTTGGEIAKSGYHVDFGGDEGFQLSGKDIETRGNVQGDVAVKTTSAFSPLAAYGVVLAMAVPRVELKMGTEELFEAAGLSESTVKKVTSFLQHSPTIGKWLSPGPNPLAVEGAAYFQVVISTTVAASGMQSLVPCKQFTLNLNGQVGADGKFLGSSTSTPTKDIFTKAYSRWDPGAKICGAPG